MTEKCTGQDEIAAFLDGELKGEAEALFKQHLEGCPRCRLELTKWQEMYSLLDLPPVDPGTGFAESVLAAINPLQNETATLQTEGMRYPRRLKNTALLLAGVLLVAVSLSSWLFSVPGWLPLLEAAGESCRLVLRTAFGLLPAPMAMILYQLVNSLGGFLASLLPVLQQKLLFLFSLGETFFVVIRALPPLFWPVMLATGFISSLLLGKLLGNEHHLI